MKFLKVFLTLLFVGFVLGCATTEKSDKEMHEPKAMGGEINLKEEVQAARKKAWEEGKYSCCLNTPCDQCIINMGGCPCGENLLNGNPVCHECKGGWDAGDGKFEDINPEDVKVMPRGKM